MYGQIHVCVRALVIEKFGEDTWNKILEKAGCDDTRDFLVFHRYGDDLTLKLVGTVSEVLNVPVPAVLEIFGEYFFQYCLQHGYDKMLRTLGDNFESFVQNLDSLHSLLAMSYKNIDAPSFRCEGNADGSVTLHYYTSRVGLYPIVTGLLRAVGKELFSTDVQCEVLNVDEGNNHGHFKQHVTFKVTFVDDSVKAGKSKHSKQLLPKAASVPNFKPSFPDNPLVTPRTFCQVFPFHIIFDSNLMIKQSGVNIQRLCHLNGKPQLMTDVFALLHPNMPLTYHHILRFINANFIIELKPREATKGWEKLRQTKLILKGQMIWLEDMDHIIFIGSPRLSSLSELMERKVFLSDIPLYDVTRELVLLNQQRIAEIEVSKKLDETTAELKRTALALEAEKKKTDMLLHQMLPVKVAEQLREGKKVEAEKFKEVTILFSDIVTFTNIAAAVQPIEIVSMLNALYSKFDALTNVHDVYKVETIGDAYMVVGGVPEASKTHAQQVANQGIDMVEAAREVNSPATGKPLQIRVGIHTGPVVAGVVGDKMPRYCLFGDTVNTASRMESHGTPGKIHVSPFTKRALEGTPYKLEVRGEIEVKGKGKMTTYFLHGHHEKTLVYDESGEISHVIHTPSPLKNVGPVNTATGAANTSSSLENPDLPGKMTPDANGQQKKDSETGGAAIAAETDVKPQKAVKSRNKNKLSSTCAIT